MQKEKVIKKTKQWKIFEDDCHKYLMENYKDSNVNFNKVGESNPNSSDIEVVKDNKNIFNIEIKMKKSQCSQFTLRIEDDKFIYSKLNKSKNNDYSKEIIDYLNLNYDTYKDVKQSTLKVDLPKEIYKKWIIDYYYSLNSKFIITGTKKNKIILPVEKIEDYFKITCCLRRKKSGSREMPKSDYNIIKEYLNNSNIEFKEFFNHKNKFFIKFNKKVNEDFKFSIKDNSYLISVCENGKIGQIKKPNKTNNPTIIFSLELYNNEQSKKDLDIFINYLKKECN